MRNKGLVVAFGFDLLAVAISRGRRLAHGTDGRVTEAVCESSFRRLACSPRMDAPERRVVDAIPVSEAWWATLATCKPVTSVRMRVQVLKPMPGIEVFDLVKRVGLHEVSTRPLLSSRRRRSVSSCSASFSNTIRLRWRRRPRRSAHRALRTRSMPASSLRRAKLE